MIHLYRFIKMVQDRAPEILFAILVGTLGYAIYLLEYGLVQ